MDGIPACDLLGTPLPHIPAEKRRPSDFRSMLVRDIAETSPRVSTRALINTIQAGLGDPVPPLKNYISKSCDNSLNSGLFL